MKKVPAGVRNLAFPIRGDEPNTLPSISTSYSLPLNQHDNVSSRGRQPVTFMNLLPQPTFEVQPFLTLYYAQRCQTIATELRCKDAFESKDRKGGEKDFRSP